MKRVSYEYVVSMKTTDESRGWKFYCPSCGGNDCWYTDDNMLAYCFNCGDSFIVDTPDHHRPHRLSLQRPSDSVIAAIRSLYTTLTKQYHTVLPTHAKEYLYRRGLDDTAIATFSLGYCPDYDYDVYHTELAKLAGVVVKQKPALRHRITIPYLYHHEVTDIRGRVIGTQTPTYLSLSGRSVMRGALYPFNLDRALTHSEDYVIITEGEFKAMLADMHGFPVIAFPGISSIRFDPSFINQRAGIIMFDSQEDMRYIDAAIYRLTRKFPTVSWFVATLPRLGLPKMDIDTFLLHPNGGYHRFRTCVESALPVASYIRLRAF